MADTSCTFFHEMIAKQLAFDGVSAGMSYVGHGHALLNQSWLKCSDNIERD